MYTEKELPYNFYDSEIGQQTFDLVHANKESIIKAFYGYLLGNKNTSEFLTHKELESRLKASFESWLDYTFDSQRVLSDPQAFLEYQDNIGRVHSRINISLFLINYAKVVLKRCIFRVIPEDKDMACYISDVIDYAVDTFNQSYLNEVVENTRHRQSLRIVASGHQLALDFERAKGEVTAWIRDKIWNESQKRLSSVKRVTELNIFHWLKHKGAFSIIDEELIKKLLDQLYELDKMESDLSALTKDPDKQNKRYSLLQEMMRIAEEICGQLEETIKQVIEADSRKDALTKALSRRYLPAIAQKEVMYARNTGASFCIMMIDIDDFKLINDTHGHRAGDAVLEELAEILMNRVRPGDYVFRYGGEEFLTVVSETNIDTAAHIAEDIRLQVFENKFQNLDKDAIRFSVSIGVAEYDFHPDFMRTVEVADKRLYKAKTEGKNQVVKTD